ncbi:MAG: sodium:calcium antiporter [bacterium]
MKGWISIFVMAALAVPWILIKFTGAHLEPHLIAILSGLAIVASSFLLTWGAELAEMEVSKSLALAFLAIVTVLPEYAVDMYLSWMAGKDQVYTHYAVANMTGANRLIIGLAWATVVFIFWFKTKKTTVELGAPITNEFTFLTLATLYSFVIPLKKNLSLVDAAVFLLLFIGYIVLASRAKVEEPHLEGPAAEVARLSRSMRRLVTVIFFLFSCFVILISASAFAESLITTGKLLKIEEFLLIQWLAPLASEAPEFIVAALFALKCNPVNGMGALISSKVNQWTLLVGMIPLVFSISSGSVHPMPLDGRQVEEVLLTSAQSLFAIAILADLRISVWEALSLLVLFVTQLLMPWQAARLAFSWVYILLAVGILVAKRQKLFCLIGYITGASKKLCGKGKC